MPNRRDSAYERSVPQYTASPESLSSKGNIFLFSQSCRARFSPYPLMRDMGEWAWELKNPGIRSLFFPSYCLPKSPSGISFPIYFMRLPAVTTYILSFISKFSSNIVISLKIIFSPLLFQQSLYVQLLILSYFHNFFQ